MTLDLTTIAIFGLLALIYGALLPARWRGWALFGASVLGVYLLQPRLILRGGMDYLLPTLTLTLTIGVWWLTRKRDDPAPIATAREDRIALAAAFALMIGVAATRYLAPDYRITSFPPNPFIVALALGGIALAGGMIRARLSRWPLLTLFIALIVLIFVVVKTEPPATAAARLIRAQTGQDITQAGMTDLAGWVGFSYVAFRLIHLLRDRQSGRLPALSLRETLTYVVFPASYIAGPIDRAERFSKDFRALIDLRGMDAPRWVEGSTRIAVGVFKKFVIADTLALGAALNTINAAQADSTFGVWLLLYGYALRLFFDFSGYSDIAIGIALLFGIRLPENFDRPYLKSDIASFWQSWHMTLSQWARFYIFTPVSRLLLTRQPKPSPTLIVLCAQIATMTTIGLWHGVTVNFLIWGLWHGAGLFVHKQWSDRTRKWYLSLKDKPGQKRAWTVFGWFVTFHFVMLGWVWFALPDFGASLRVFGLLFGL
jgi:D-alanyl-lipoteichoic acid acyltransferase DltB (MBOAT superfamily)